MTPLIVIAAIAVGLLIVCLTTRINAIFMFVAVATGELLSRFIGDSASLALGGFIGPHNADVVGPLFLLWIPVVLSILFLRRSLPASTLVLQVVPLVFSSAAAALLTLHYLTQGFQQSVYSAPQGHMLNNIQDLVIAGAGVSTFLLILVIGRPRHEDKHHGKHGKHH